MYDAPVAIAAEVVRTVSLTTASTVAATLLVESYMMSPTATELVNVVAVPTNCAPVGAAAVPLPAVADGLGTGIVSDGITAKA